MSAKVIILPHIRIERYGEGGGASIMVSLTQRDYARLTARANEWKVSQSVAAGYILADALKPPRRVKR